MFAPHTYISVREYCVCSLIANPCTYFLTSRTNSAFWSGETLMVPEDGMASTAAVSIWHIG